MQQTLPGLQILLNDVCPHAVLPRNCSTCQMETFIAINQQSDIPLLKDIQRSILQPLVQDGQQAYTLDFRYAADHEPAVADVQTNETRDYDGLVTAATVFEPKKTVAERIEAYRQQSAQFGIEPDSNVEENIALDVNDDEDNDRPSQLPEDLKRLRIVFIGPLESYLGFLCCLLSKYGSTTLIPSGLTLGAYEKINKLIHERWVWEGDVDQCIFKRHPEACAYLQRGNGGEGDDLMSTTNVEEFLVGYMKMRELDVIDVMARNDDELTLHVKGENHATECQRCLDDGDEMGAAGEERPFSDYPPVTACKAYWYFL